MSTLHEMLASNQINEQLNATLNSIFGSSRQSRQSRKHKSHKSRTSHKSRSIFGASRKQKSRHKPRHKHSRSHSRSRSRSVFGSGLSGTPGLSEFINHLRTTSLA